MKRSIDFESIIDPAECDALIAKITQHKVALKRKVREMELTRLKDLNPDWTTEIDSYRPSNMTNAIGSFTVDKMQFHMDQFKPKESCRIVFFDLRGGVDFIVRKSGAVTSDFDLKWDKMDRIVEFARFLIMNAKF